MQDMRTMSNPYTDTELARCWQVGYDESGEDFGRTWDDDPESPRSVAYDEGRTAGESDRALRLHGGRGYKA